MRYSQVSVTNGDKLSIDWNDIHSGKKLGKYSRSQQCQINVVNIPEVCDRMMESIKTKQSNVKFRTLSRLFLDTISLFTAQVKDLYKTTYQLNQNVRRSINCTTIRQSGYEEDEQDLSMDFHNLLSEFEASHNITEDHFNLPELKEDKKCHTIKEVRWEDSNDFFDEEYFDKASPDELAMFLSDMDDVINNFDMKTSNGHKRKLSCDTIGSPPLKKLKESHNGFGCDPENLIESVHGESINHTINGKLFDHDQEMMDVFNVTPLKSLPDFLSKESHTVKQAYNRFERKRKSEVIIDRETKISRKDMDAGLADIWRKCLNFNDMEHIVQIESVKQHRFLGLLFLHQRFKGKRLFDSFNAKLKGRPKQNHTRNRKLIFEEIFSNDIKTSQPELPSDSMKRNVDHTKKPLKNVRTRSSQAPTIDENNNTPTMTDLNGNKSPREIYFERQDTDKADYPMNFLLHNVNTNEVSFDFPPETETNKSEWGKRSILMKLIEAWKMNGPQVDMNTLITGANRIEAALVFCVLLELAAMRYIVIVKGNSNSIQSIREGPEIIKKLIMKLM